MASGPDCVLGPPKTPLLPLSSLLLLLLLICFCFAFRCIIIMLIIVVIAAEVQWNKTSLSSVILSPEVLLNRFMCHLLRRCRHVNYNPDKKIKILSPVLIQIVQPYNNNGSDLIKSYQRE